MFDLNVVPVPGAVIRRFGIDAIAVGGAQPIVVVQAAVVDPIGGGGATRAANRLHPVADANLDAWPGQGFAAMEAARTCSWCSSGPSAGECVHGGNDGRIAASEACRGIRPVTRQRRAESFNTSRQSLSANFGSVATQPDPEG